MANIVDIIINARDSASDDIERVGKSLEGLRESGLKGAGWVSAISGGIAILAPASAAVAGLGASFLAAGVAAGAYGAVAAGVLKDTFDKSAEIKKAEDALKKADSAKERIAAQKQLQAAMAGVSAEQKTAITNMNNFKTFWGDFTKQFEKPILGTFSTGLQLAQSILTKLQPTIAATAGVVQELMDKMLAAVNGGALNGFFSFLETNGAEALMSFATIAGNTIGAVTNVLMAFAPVGASVEEGLVSLSARFLAWSQTMGQSQGFQNFMNYVREQTPKVLSIIGNLWNFIVKLVIAIAPLGSAVLSVASAFASWLANSGTMSNILAGISAAGQFLKTHLDGVKTTLIALVGAFAAFKVVMGIINFVKTAIAIFNILKTTFLAVRTAVMAMNLAFLANPITWIIIAIVALIAIVILLVKNWDTVKAKALELWAKMKEVWAGIVTAVTTAASNMWSAITTWASNMWNKFKEMMSNIGQAVATGAGKVLQFFLSLPMKIVNGLIYGIGFIIGVWIGLMLGIANAIKNGAIAAINFFKQLPTKIVNFVTTMKDKVVSGFKNMMDKGKTEVSNGTNAVVKFFSQLPSKIMNFITNVKNSVVNGFKNAMSSAKSAVSTGVSAVIQFFSQLPSKISNFVTTTKNNLVNGFKNAMSGAKSAISSGVSNCISAIKNFGSTFLSAGKGLLDAFVKGIKSGISKATSAVKDGMAAVRKFLPFSPAKKGPLSDLDKSGESFFPTWYNGALKNVRPMTKALGGALDKANGALERDHGGVALEAFSGGRSRLTVTHNHEHSGTVTVEGDSSKETFSVASNSVITKTETDVLQGLRQAIRQR